MVPAKKPIKKCIFQVIITVQAITGKSLIAKAGTSSGVVREGGERFDIIFVYKNLWPGPAGNFF